MSKRLLIIGNGLSGIAFAEKLLERETDWQVTICRQGEFTPYFPSKVADYIAGKTNSSKVFYWEDKKLEAAGISSVEEKIIRINFNKKEVTLESKERLGYDVLLLTDFPGARVTEIKGANKEGLYVLGRLEDAAGFVKRIALAENVAVFGQTPMALSTALALRKRDKEVLYITETEDPFAGFLDGEDSRILWKKAEAEGIRFLPGQKLDEILGEREVKAVRLGSGKVFAVEGVWWDVPDPDFRWIKDAEWFSGSGIIVDEGCRTPAEGVWAFGRLLADSVKRPQGADSDSELLLIQGRNAARQYLGESDKESLPERAAHWDLAGQTLALRGRTLDFDRQTAAEEGDPLRTAPEENHSS